MGGQFIFSCALKNFIEYRTRAKIRLGLLGLRRAYLRKISKNASFRAMLIQKIVKKEFDATPHEVVHNLHFHHIGVKGIRNG